MDALVVGCGLSGSVIARKLAESGRTVEIWDRRNHIGGNMYDYVNEHGYLVHKYGPHIFHTTEKELFDFMCQYEEWKPYQLTCGAVINGTFTPTPFNFTTIEQFYPRDEAEKLKAKLLKAYNGRKAVPVTEVLSNDDPDIRAYAEFLFRNDYAPYTAKQWGVSPEEIDPSVLKRVPLRLSDDIGYFEDPYEAMPVHSYTAFFKNLLDHPNIQVRLSIEALDHLRIENGIVFLDGVPFEGIVVYTGALDEIFGCRYGKLPYRSLRFDWKYSEKESFQEAPVVAYPQEKEFTRITEYTILPRQKGNGTVYAVEYPNRYQEGQEPYYPVLTEESQRIYALYEKEAKTVKNFYYCGRLADFKYYNMDQALGKAINVFETELQNNCKKIIMQ